MSPGVPREGICATDWCARSGQVITIRAYIFRGINTWRKVAACNRRCASRWRRRQPRQRASRALHAQEAPAPAARPQHPWKRWWSPGSRLQTPNETSISPITTVSGDGPAGDRPDPRRGRAQQPAAGVRGHELDDLQRRGRHRGGRPARPGRTAHPGAGQRQAPGPRLIGRRTQLFGHQPDSRRRSSSASTCSPAAPLRCTARTPSRAW